LKKEMPNSKYRYVVGKNVSVDLKEVMAERNKEGSIVPTNVERTGRDTRII